MSSDQEAQANGSFPDSRSKETPWPNSTYINPKPHKPKYQNLIENFTAQWFTVVMNTGVLGILFWNQPYQFHGLHILATICYVFALLLFVTFGIISILRWTLFHKTTVSAVSTSLQETAMLGAPAIAWSQITALTALIVSNAPWGGHAWTVLAVVMWWFGAAWMVATTIGVCFNMFLRDVTYDRTITPALFIPCVGVSTQAVAGAVVCRYAYEISAGLAVPVLVMNYLLNGLGIFISLIIYTIYTHRLMAVGLPDGPATPGLMLLVGPFGQTGAALILTGSAASTRHQFADYNSGPFLTESGARTVSSAGTMFALLFLGFDLFWLIIAICGIARGAINKSLSYSLLWQGTIFPVATVTTTFVALSSEMDSVTFRVLAAIFTIYLTVNYLINWVFIVWKSVTSDLLIKKEAKDD